MLISSPCSSAFAGLPDRYLSLPPIKPFQQVHNLQRYGFGHLLSENLNLTYTPRPFSVSWQHGIYSHESSAQIKPYLVNENHCDTKDLIVVATYKDLAFLRSWGFKNVIVGGLPFCYTTPSRVKKARVLLSFSGHSAESCNQKISICSDYLYFLLDFKKYFDAIIISEYALDRGSDFYRQAVELGFHVIPGADPADANSLKRTRQILDSVTHVTTNCAGSHIFYALATGCKVSICGPLKDYSFNSEIQLVLDHSSADEVRKSMTYGGQFTSAQVSRLFVSNPLDGIHDVPFGKEAIGSDFVIHDRRVLMAMLRWSPTGQVSGYIEGAVRRFLRSQSRLNQAKSN